MRSLLCTMIIVLTATFAWSWPPDPPQLSFGYEKVVSLNQVNPVALRIAQCNVIGSFSQPQTSRTCDLAIAPYSQPIVLREVQVHTAPYAEQPGQLFWGAQCWTRVQVSEDGQAFHEIAKFSWPVGDFHGINRTLPVPIEMDVSKNAVLRAIVGITSIEPDECRVEVKVYSTSR